MVICPQVSLAAIFYVATRDGAQAYRNKIDRKLIDFLLCDPQTLKPIMGLELDDSSHQREDRQQRDMFVEQVFESAGLPIIRVPARSAYSVEEVNALLADGLALSTQVSEAAAANAIRPGSQNGKTPTCPKCGIPMVVRVSRKDRRRFWGCTNYPRCTQTAPLEE